MIYLDSSVVLAHLLLENQTPPDSLWRENLVSSRLLEYEVWTRINAYAIADTRGEAAQTIIARISLIEMTPIVLERALEPFPVPVRTLDALHLASIEFLRSQKQDVALASYDQRLVAAARGLGVAAGPP